MSTHTHTINPHKYQPVSPALQADSSLSEPREKPLTNAYLTN